MTATDPVLARIERAIRETEAFLELVSSEWTSQEQIDDAEMHLDIALALKSAVERHGDKGDRTCKSCLGFWNNGTPLPVSINFPCNEYKDIAEKLGVVL